MLNTRPQLICLTPVKNEAWILDRFLRAASLWADLIIVADQQSTDGSREIVAAHPKAVLVDNDSDRYDEGARQRLLLEAARNLSPGPRILFALDADEALTADALAQPEWNRVISAVPGTVIRMQWVNVLPDEPCAWIPPGAIVFGFADDGSPHAGDLIHSPRLPFPSAAPVLDLTKIKVLHLQYLETERMRSKQRWYQAWERVELPRRRPVQIYRRYHHMDAINPDHRYALQRGWLEGYEACGISLLANSQQSAYSWDEKVMDLVDEHGAKRFRRVDIWSVDWRRKAASLGRRLPPGMESDPRSRLDRRVLDWLARTQLRAGQSRVRWAQRALRLLGW